jgi:hypothetical protein
MVEYSRDDMIKIMILRLEDRAYELIEELGKGYQIKELRELKEFKLSCLFKQIENYKKELEA